MVGWIGKVPDCQVPGCRTRVGKVVEIDLLTSWDAADGYPPVLTVTVGACRFHGGGMARRAQAVLAARLEFARLVGRTARDGVLAARLREVQDAIVEAEGALAYQRERAERGEAVLARPAHLQVALLEAEIARGVHA